MLKHPWLDMPDNYEFKYTEREYEVMMLKKELKNSVKGGNNSRSGTQQEDPLADERQEMNELIESDPELYGADNEDTNIVTKKNERDLFKAEMMTGASGVGVLSGSAAVDQMILADIFNADEVSLEDPSEAREHYKRAKEAECKIHNSFTGPYPLDPTEFSHTDKGENAQFTTLIQW